MQYKNDELQEQEMFNLFIKEIMFQQKPTKKLQKNFMEKILKT